MVSADAARSEASGRGRVLSAGALGGAALLLSAVALVNGFPLVYPDTATYVTPHLLPYRTPFYNAFAIALHLQQSLWPIVAAQGLIAAWVLRVTARSFFGWGGAGRLLLLVAGLAAASSLPWFTGQLLPDVFAGLLVLAVAVLALVPGCCTRAERVGLAGLAAAACLFHQSHGPLALAVLAACLALRGLRAGRAGLRTLRLPAAAVAGGLALLALTNLALWGRLTVSVHGATFLLGNTIQHGPTLDYLRETCPERGWALCPYLHLMPWRDDQEFLWRAESPFGRAGGFDALRDEAREIVAGSFRARPAAFAATVLRTGWRQLLTFPTGEDNPSFLADDFPTHHLRLVFPESFPAYAGSLQSRGRFPIPAVVRLHEGVFVLCVLAAPWLAWRLARSGRRAPADLGVVIAVAVVANAFVLGGLSGVVARYQSRIVWLPVAFALAAALTPRARGPSDPAAPRRARRPGH